MAIPNFRRASREDLPAIIALLADDSLGKTREIVGKMVDPAYLSAFSAIDLDPNQFLLVVEIEAEIVGCLQISFIPGLSRRGMWRGQIESVRIAKEHRGAGLGKAMIKWAVGRCRARGCGLVQLTTDKARTEALGFYERLGFTASHEGMKLKL